MAQEAARVTATTVTVVLQRLRALERFKRFQITAFAGLAML